MGFGGSGGGGSGSIAASSDVTLNNPAANQVLSYDGATSKWRNSSLENIPQSAVSSLTSDLAARPVSTSVNIIWTGTQAEYDALSSKVATTLYIIR